MHVIMAKCFFRPLMYKTNAISKLADNLADYLLDSCKLFLEVFPTREYEISSANKFFSLEEYTFFKKLVPSETFWVLRIRPNNLHRFSQKTQCRLINFYRMSAAIVGKKKKEKPIFFHLHNRLHFEKFDSIDFLGPEKITF